MANYATHPFDKCGIAALADLQTSEWKALFETMESEQAAFLAKESLFRSPEYKWPRDPLHTWSRCWEYPYVYHHISQNCKDSKAGTPQVVDMGSGVTFFPLAVAKLGCNVICTDIDPVCERDIPNAATAVSPTPDRISFRLAKPERLPFNDGEVDIVYSVSVLEHIPTLRQAVDEIHRILKPGGQLILTFDLDLRGDSEIGPRRYRELKTTLLTGFRIAHAEQTTHPADLLKTINGPYPLTGPRGAQNVRFFARRVKRLLMGQPQPYRIPYFLSVEGLVLEKPAR